MNNKTLLRVLLVLTFVFAGLSCFTYLMMSVMLPSLRQFYMANTTMFPAELHTMMTTFLDMPQGYFLAAGLLYGLEVTGAALMWNLSLSGFHCYTLARLLLLLVPLLFLGRGYVGLGDIMMALLFVFVYWRLLKTLRPEATESEIKED